MDCNLKKLANFFQVPPVSRGGGLLYERGEDARRLVFWSHLGCSGQNAIILSREGLVRVAREEI